MEKDRQMDMPLQHNFVDTLPLVERLPKGPHTGAPGAHDQKDHPWPWGQYLREMFEVALGLTLVVVASLFIPRNWAASELIFCAFFLVVFATALRYSTATAYTGSILAAVSYCLLLLRHPALYAPFDSRYVLMEAFLLLTCGVILHTMSQAQRQRFSTAEQQQVHQAVLLLGKTHEYHKALMLNAELERHIAGQTTTVITINDRLARLWELEGDARYSAIVDLVVHALGAQSCAVYVQREGGMQFVAGQPAGARASAAPLNPGDPLISSVLRQRQVRSVRDLLACRQAVSEQVAVMAGPLLDRDGQVVGVVIIDTLPLLKFTPSAVRLFSSLLRLASLVLQSAAPGGRGEQDAFSATLSLFGQEHSASAGPPTPLPEVESQGETYRSLLSLYPTQRTASVVQDTRTGYGRDEQ